jgi:dephospho-CoA kinase
MIIGLTGIFGSGKSEVARIFGEMGAQIIPADDIGKQVVDSDPLIRYRLVLAFGNSILSPDHRIKREKLARLAFASAKATQKLNEIVHPALLCELDRLLEDSRKQKGNIVIDAALLIYWDYQIKMDITIVVTAPSADRQRRLLAKGFSREEIEKRTKSQLSQSALGLKADMVLKNNGTLAELQGKARNLYISLTKNG